MNLQKISAELNSIIITTGEYIIEQRRAFSLDKVEIKALNQLVSYVDINAEKQLVEELSKLMPEAGFITEENTSDKGRAMYNWIIDPLDGTTNFIHDVPVYSISVALAKGEDILVGAVYELGRKELFTAWKNGGAWLNGNPINVSSETDLSKTLIATGFPYYDFEQMDAYINVLKHLLKSTHGLRRMGSAAVDMAYVACGRFEGFFEYGLHAWDLAAGILLVKEAGGNVVDFKGENNYLFGETIISGNGHIDKDLLKLIKSEF
ncbi:MAG: inositol monophosphatase family protein [bacterium]|nr:inositol monophosphatase family protein [bacterium]